jgi:hypothetical protein
MEGEDARHGLQFIVTNPHLESERGDSEHLRCVSARLGLSLPYKVWIWWCSHMKVESCFAFPRGVRHRAST